MDTIPLAASPSKTLELQIKLGLTRSEALIVLGLVQGDSLNQIAAARGVSISTVRNQVKSAMAKTATNRQAELAVLADRQLRQAQ